MIQLESTHCQMGQTHNKKIIYGFLIYQNECYDPLDFLDDQLNLFGLADLCWWFKIDTEFEYELNNQILKKKIEN